MHIEQITPQLTWQLRRDVLYPSKRLYEMEMEEDAHGYHFGIFTDDRLIGIVSLFDKDSGHQFRKFAVEPAYQGKGYGMALLAYAAVFAQSLGARRLWCNARLPAFGFYLKSGFTETGQYFSKNGFEYAVMEKTS